MTSGGCRGGDGASGFLRFLPFVLCGMAFEFGRATSGSGGILGAAEGTCAGGGDSDGREEGGEYVVMSTEGDLARFPEDSELGDGESSGGAGGGRTKWKVRDAICICELGELSARHMRRMEKGRTGHSEEPCYHFLTKHHPPTRRSDLSPAEQSVPPLRHTRSSRAGARHSSDRRGQRLHEDCRMWRPSPPGHSVGRL